MSKKLAEGAVKKERKPRTRDTWYLAVYDELADTYTPLVIGDNKSSVFPSREAAFKASKSIPDLISENNVVIISTSKQLLLKRTVYDKVTIGG